MISPQYILLMKVGPYCGYTLNEIIDIKQKEEERVGKFFWGYSGVFCRPNIINNFLSHAIQNDKNIKVLFSETKSSFNTKNPDRFEKYSKDGSKWEELNKNVLLVGNKEKKHFAITGKDLKKENIKLDISQYCTLIGMFPNTNQYLDTYFKYRVDKACGYYLPRKNVKEKIIEVQYICDLVEPYSLYIR